MSALAIALAIELPTSSSSHARRWLWLTAVSAEAPSTRALQQQFEAVFAASGAAIWRLCRFRERDPDARRDLYQEIALAIWRSLPSFRGESTQATWALRIAHNVAASHVGRALRKRAAVERLEDDQAAQQTAVDDQEHDERVLDVSAALKGLDLPSQQIVLLYLEGLDSRAIAEVVGTSASNVGTRLTRIRQRLAKRLQEESIDE